MDVFDRMHKANSNGLGIELSHADLELVYELAGDALAKAQQDIDTWQEIFRNNQKAREREQRQQGQGV
jgi:hypothetical protein